MDREINIDSIRLLEKQVGEHEKAIIRLKRTRNSLLNVSTLLLPEILTRIFRWNVIPGGDFGGLLVDSYNFLLVCHHWFEVASRAPELWSFWGNSTRDWKRRRARCGTRPIDLVLEGHTSHELDDELRDVLRDRATRDTIRRIHLRGIHRVELLSSVISSIVVDGEETRSSNVESFIVQSSGGSDVEVDVSSFFSRYHLPKLKCLRLVGCRISPLDFLESRTATLTTLGLTIGKPSPNPTLSQLLSILSSSPLLQDLALFYSLDPDAFDGEKSSPLVPLHHLKNFRLSSDLRHAFLLISRLELPDEMNSLDLSLFGCSPSDLSQTLGPYLRDRIQRRGRLPGHGLGLLVTHTSPAFRFRIGDTDRHDDSAGMVWFMTVDAVVSGIPVDEVERRVFGLTTYIPREQVIDLRTTLPILRSQESCVKMRNLTRLHLEGVDLYICFVEPEICGSHKFEELLPSLDHIVITKPTLSGRGWSPLTNFLSRRAAVGNRISSLRISCRPHMDEDIAGDIKRAVTVYEDDGSDENEGSGWDEVGYEGGDNEEDDTSDEDDEDDEDGDSDEDESSDEDEDDEEE